MPPRTKKSIQKRRVMHENKPRMLVLNLAAPQYDVAFMAALFGKLKDTYLSRKADRDVNVNFILGTSQPAVLLTATAARFPIGVERLLSQSGLSVDIADIHGQTPTHRAVLVKDAEYLQFLLKHKCRIDIQDNMGRLPLHLAAFSNSIPCVDVLLEHGPEIHSTGKEDINMLEVKSKIDQRTPIEDAVAGGHLDVLKRLLQTYYDWVTDHDRRSAATRRLLHLAVQWNRYDCVDFLVKFGLDVNQALTDQDPTDTPLYRSVQQRKIEMVRRLRSLGANPCLPDGLNFPLMYACSHGFAEMVPLLFTESTSRECILQIAGLGLTKEPYERLTQEINKHRPNLPY